MKIEPFPMAAGPKTRKEYASLCRLAVEMYRDSYCKFLRWQYVYKHDKHRRVYNVDTRQLDLVHEKIGPRVGVIAAYLTPDDDLYMGVSRCDVRVDTFERYIGVYLALRAANPVASKEIREIFKDVPQSMYHSFAYLLDRFRAPVERPI